MKLLVTPPMDSYVVPQQNFDGGSLEFYFWNDNKYIIRIRIQMSDGTDD